MVETIYKGKIRPFGKTKGSLTEVPIAKELSENLIAWRRVSQQQYDGTKKTIWPAAVRAGAFMFPNRDWQSVGRWQIEICC